MDLMNPYYIRYDSSDNNLFLVLGPSVVKKNKVRSQKNSFSLAFFNVGYLIIKEEADDRAEYMELLRNDDNSNSHSDIFRRNHHFDIF